MDYLCIDKWSNIMLLPELQRRRSEFAFSPRMVEDEKIRVLFEAAQQAPSSMNVQPWRYVYATPACNTFEKIVAALHEGNQRWAKEAPLLIISIAQTAYEFNGTTYTNRYAWHDTGMANVLLMIQATHMGLISHPMGGFSAKALTETLNIPSPYEPVVVIAVGYPGDTKNLPPDLLERQNRPRVRMQLSHVYFYESWPDEV
ncbi:MAG: nitroreductase family protein [Bacteroidales bacterium]